MVAVVLLGAGASHGSEDSIPSTPPLGKDLFDKLEAQGGLAATFSPELKAKFRENFEVGMAEYCNAGGNIEHFQRDLARYLAQFQPGPNSVYCQLIRELGIDRVLYSSLNYDVLFEAAAGHLGFAFNYTAEKHRRSVRLLKPHGSCNVWPRINPDMFVNCTFNGSEIVSPAYVATQEETIYRCLTDTSLAPSMSIIAPGKKLQICTNWVEEQQEAWRRAISKASNIFVVGVRVYPTDDHIWGVIAKSKAPITVFGYSNQDKNEFNEWANEAKRKNAYFVQSDFKSSVPWMRKKVHGR